MKGKIVENCVQNLSLFPLPPKISMLSITEALKTKSYDNSLLTEKTLRSGEDRYVHLRMGGK